MTWDWSSGSGTGKSQRLSWLVVAVGDLFWLEVGLSKKTF